MSVETFKSDDPATVQFGRDHGAGLAIFAEGATAIAMQRGIAEEDFYKISRHNLIALAAALSNHFMRRAEFMELCGKLFDEVSECNREGLQ